MDLKQALFYCRGGMNKITTEQAAYLAGLIDGEGCIFISKYLGAASLNPVYSLRIVVTMTSKELVEGWQKKTGVGIIFYNPCPAKKENTSVVWQWIITVRKDAGDFLRAILPYLELKRDQAELALEFLSLAQTHCGPNVTVPQYITDQRECYRVALMEMKTRGGRVIPEPPKESGPRAEQLSFL